MDWPATAPPVGVVIDLGPFGLPGVVRVVSLADY